MERFSEQIINWYRKNGRELPWRETRDPYKIWVSEIILQQTRVRQGLPYYLKFIGTFPTLGSLANADETSVLKLWQGLGYYSRARNLLKTARKIFHFHNGIFPEDYDDLKNLDGIGDYTASAIASFAFGKKYPVIDGNVKRVVARTFGITEPVGSQKLIRRIREILSEQIECHDAAEFNQAILDFGALQCVPKNPSCGECVLNDFCFAFRNGLVGAIPVKAAKQRVSDRFFHYFIVPHNDGENERLLVSRRNDEDIWKGLYEFPLIETDHDMGIGELVRTAEWKGLFGESPPHFISSSEMYIHRLSHRRINARFYLLKSGGETGPTGTTAIRADEIASYPVSRLIEQFMEDYPEWVTGENSKKLKKS